MSNHNNNPLPKYHFKVDWNGTKIGFTDVYPGQAELLVISTIGQELYREQISTAAGENHFNFNGDKLAAGHYLFSVRKGNKIHKGMNIKN